MQLRYKVAVAPSPLYTGLQLYNELLQGSRLTIRIESDVEKTPAFELENINKLRLWLSL